jgi:polar amino acid transport system permease protein
MARPFRAAPTDEEFCAMIYGYAWDTSSDLAFALSILPILGIGLIVTLEATATGFVIALALGLVLALLRRSRLRVISWPTAGIIEFIRDTPLLVQLFFLYYVLPIYGIVLPAFLTGAIALGLQYSAYTSEVYRAGLEAVPRGQWEAAVALNMSRARAYRDIIVPQAIPRIVPALGNYLVSMLKETPVLSVVTVVDMVNLANLIGDRTFEYLVPLSLVGLIFLVLTLLCSAGIHMLERALPKSGIAMQ